MISGFTLALIVSRNPAFALLGALIGFYAPGFYVRRRHAKRLSTFNAQLGDTISLLGNAMRSGYSMLQAMDMVARESPDPTREEFTRVVREVSLGLSPEEALANLVRRIGSDDLDLLVTAINVQREVGGNLAQILDTIGTTIRERVRIQGEIKVLTSQQTLSGYVITMLPIALGVLLYLINPKYMSQLFSTEQMICMPVIAMPICGGIMMLLGFLVIKKIVAIEV
jgi:tight adherence protein B